jgi:hypothetical protein
VKLTDFEVTRVHGQYLPPIWSSGGFSDGYNVYGFLTTSDRGYVQVFRNGIIESAAGNAASRDDQGRWVLFAETVEDEVTVKVDAYMKALAHANASPPVLVMLSAVRMHIITVIGNPKTSLPPRSYPLDSAVQFPSITLDEFGPLEDYRRALKPMFDAVWNAAGYPGSRSYGPDGNWMRRS